ncbi:MAG TPA: dihydropteroate synthase, partial [Nitrospirota bacterium]|nr:dihydropteroate synthase [Nitrospirota bacterium]
MKTRHTLTLGGVTLELSSRTHIMGVLNITPDSFSDGGRFISSPGGVPEYGKAIDFALRMSEEGADIIDIGGESTRPGSETVPPEEEMRRVLPVIEGIRKHSRVPLSIDTRKAVTARMAVAAGASMINDISGAGFDPEMLDTASVSGAALVLMHMKGTPADMQADPRYDDVVGEVAAYLDARAQRAISSGIARDRIVIDPGIGFGKTLEHNLALIAGLDRIAALGYPVLLGVSRKAFIGKLTGGAAADDRLEGTIAADTAGIMKGADIIR